jgi:hypothetical protein
MFALRYTHAFQQASELEVSIISPNYHNTALRILPSTKMKPTRVKFGYTGIRVRDLDGAIDFFTKHLEMILRSRVKADWSKGEFANLVS